MKKRIFILSISTLVIVLVVFIINKHNEFNSEQNSTLPDLVLNGINSGEAFLINELENKKPMVLSLLSVECNHCKYQAMDIYHNSNLYAGLNHIIILEQHDSLENFLNSTNLINGNGYTLTSTQYDIVDLFDIKGFPSTMLYDSSGHFINEIAGEIKVEKLTIKIRECLNQD